MYILWKKHPYKPELNGTKEHVARSLGEVAVGYGQAELCPRPNYGTPEWAAERAADEKGIAPAVVAWGIHRNLNTSRPSIVGRCSREVCGTLRFEGRPEDAHRVAFIHGHDGRPPEKIPVDVMNAYVAAVKENAGELSPDEALAIMYGASKGDSGKRRKLFEGYKANGEPIYKEPWW